MSRNPYLAATRPTSSFTRSSRSSKRNEPTSGKGSLLGRSRSSANIGSGLSNSLASSSYGLTSGYTPSTSNWQRSASSTRLNRLSSSETAPSSSYKSSDYTPSSQRSSDKVSNHSHELPRPCILRLSRSNTDENEAKQNADNSRSSEHLKNYQQSRTQQSPTRVQSVQSLDSEDSAYAKRSTTSLDSSATEFSYDESDGIISGSAPRHLKQGQLLKSRSLDVSQQPSADSASPLIGAMSVDRLLLRSESMSERDLRKSYKELVMENERLKRQMRGIDEREKQKQQDWIRKERQLHRKISELEEENRQVEQWKQEIQRLQDENRSLIRVVSKLSKQN